MQCIPRIGASPVQTFEDTSTLDNRCGATLVIVRGRLTSNGHGEIDGRNRSARPRICDTPIRVICYTGDMEKRRPHYRLSEIQNVVLLRGLDAFTKTAIDNADAMGLSDTQMIQAVLNMNKKTVSTRA